MNKKRNGQSTVEYAVLILVIVAALVAIQVYMKRGVEGKMRDSSDRIGEQYSAGHMSSTETTTQTGAMGTTETFGVGTKGESVYTVTEPAKIDKQITEETTKKLDEEPLLPR